MVLPLKTTALFLGIVASIILWSNDGVYATPTLSESDKEIANWIFHVRGTSVNAVEEAIKDVFGTHATESLVSKALKSYSGDLTKDEIARIVGSMRTVPGGPDGLHH